MTTRDNELFVVLAAALGPVPAAEPTRAELARLHRVIDGSTHRRAPFWRIPRPLSAALAGFVVLGGASAAAAASGAVMPEPVRVAVRALGLPVDSPQTADVRSAIARLRDALDARPRNVSEIRERAQQLREDLARLSAGDRVGIDPQANFLLVEADNAVVPPPTPSAPPRSAAPPATVPPQPLARSDEHHSGDDHSTASTVPARSDDGGGEHATTTVQTQTSGPDGGGSGGGGGSGSDGGGFGSDGGGSGHDGGGASVDGGGGHSGPG